MVERKVLQNGLTVVYEKIDYVRSVSTGVFIKNGSVHESEDNLGISHFIEHMLFKGTNKRSAKQIAVEMDAVGGVLNAYTTKEYTCYHTKILDTYFSLSTDILSDMILNPKLSDSDIEMERNVVFEEIAMYEDAPEELVHDLFLEAAWGAGAGIGAPTLGTHETLNLFTVDNIRAYMKKTYIPQNCVIAVTGNLPDGFMDIIEEQFGLWKSGEKENVLSFQQFKPTIITKSKDIEQIHFCIGFEAFNGDNEKNYDLLAFNNIFGSSMSSDLFQKVREEKGLVYSIFSYLSNFVSMGAMVVSASMHPKNLGEVLNIIYDSIEKAKKHEILPERCFQAKEQLKGNYIMGLENVNSRMQSIGRSYLLYKKNRSPEEVLKKIDNITYEGVCKVVDNVFDFDKMCASAIGSDADKYKDLFCKKHLSSP